MQTITILNLSSNHIGDEGTKHLAMVLKYNTVTIIVPSFLSFYSHISSQTITTLDLSNNQITDSGAKSLFETLKENKVSLTLSSFLQLTFLLVHADNHRTEPRIQQNWRPKKRIPGYLVGF
jgi:Ran GTPase-activating protein (RanGAP) involved in mRNA processing and transport